MLAAFLSMYQAASCDAFGLTVMLVTMGVDALKANRPVLIHLGLLETAASYCVDVESVTNLPDHYSNASFQKDC